jgi:hypothetical protein
MWQSCSFAGLAIPGQDGDAAETDRVGRKIGPGPGRTPASRSDAATLGRCSVTVRHHVPA